MNVFTVKKVLLSAAIASLLAVPALTQASQVDGSFSNATESQSQASALGSKTATQSSSQADGHVAVTADGRAVKSRGQSVAAEGYSTSVGTARGTAARTSETSSTAQNKLATNKSSGTEVRASSESRSRASAITALETGDGVQLNIDSASQNTVAAATSLETRASGATKGLAKAAVSNAARASGALRSTATTSFETASGLTQDMGSALRADANFAAGVRAEIFSTAGSAEFLSESVVDISAGLQDTVTSLGTEIHEASSFDLESTDLHDSVAEISGELDGSAGLTGGLGL